MIYLFTNGFIIKINYIFSVYVPNFELKDTNNFYQILDFEFELP